MILTLDQALDVVRSQTGSLALPPSEQVPLPQALGRVLTKDLPADRDYPPFPRSARDGFAVRSKDAAAAPATLSLIGEVRAGNCFEGVVGPGQCVAIMTGAPVPEGADAVVMVEHTRSEGSQVTLLRAAVRRDNVVPQGSEAAAGAKVLTKSKALSAADLALMASIGATQPRVFRKPEIAILATGDELVSIDAAPRRHQIRNSNSTLLAAQVTLAGGIPRTLPAAPDEEDALRRLITEGLSSDMLLLSGGVSAGKYDLVEKVLADFGAEFYFDGVAIRPGKPLVFGRVKNKLFFGLPGNPVSTYVTFHLFARPVIAALAGGPFEPPLFLGAKLARAVQRREGLTAFIPALVSRQEEAPLVAPVSWQGSGDVAALPKANCFIVVYPHRDSPQAGDWVDVMLKT